MKGRIVREGKRELWNIAKRLRKIPLALSGFFLPTPESRRKRLRNEVDTNPSSGIRFAHISSVEFTNQGGNNNVN
jgi:hypothetical protein